MTLFHSRLIIHMLSMITKKETLKTFQNLAMQQNPITPTNPHFY